MRSIFVTTIICLTILFSGCKNINFEAYEKPEDKVVRLDTSGDSPIGKEVDYKPGDAVSIINNEGRFYADGRVKETGENIVFVEDARNSGKKKWMPVKSLRGVQAGEKSAAKGYRVNVGTGRAAIDEWFPAAQIFPAPWANNVNLKVGDTVYRKRFGDFEPDKGVVTELPKIETAGFDVQFEGARGTEWVDANEIFSSIEPAKPEDLLPGTIVYYRKMYWAIVIGKRDDKIIIRENAGAFGDIMVHISKLQILK